MEMLQNVLRMIYNANGAPLATVIGKRLIPLPYSDDISFVLQHPEYVSHDEVGTAPISGLVDCFSWILSLLLVPMHPLMTVQTRLRAAK